MEVTDNLHFRAFLPDNKMPLYLLGKGLVGTSEKV